MAECLTRKLCPEEIDELRTKAIDWALANGISMRPSSSDKDQDKVVFAPFTLFPSTIPRYCLQEATETMEHFNRLMHKVAMDHELLQDSFKSINETDEFSKSLYDIYMKVRFDDRVQPHYLGLFRNDFMLDKKDSNEADDKSFQIKQIEFNSIASSFGGLMSQQIFLHKYIMDLIGEDYTSMQIPDNSPVKGLAKGFVEAWKYYNNPKSVVLFLVSHNEKNIMDQKLLEFEVYRQNKNIRIIRKTFDDLIKTGRLTEDRKYMVGEEEVAVVYYRVGYAPQDYSTHKTWSVRLDLEKSWSIKCPPIHYQLAGAKKIQQVLAKPDVLKNYIPDDNIRQRIQATFAGQYSLDMGKEGDESLEMAVKNPENYVLKPQREGGGNNMYDSEVRAFLEKNRNSTERCSYILMEKIRPRPQINYLLKAGVPLIESLCISELGIYGCYIGKNDGEVHNETCGHLLRTKTADTNEGGICAGFAGIDTPFLS